MFTNPVELVEIDTAVEMYLEESKADIEKWLIIQSLGIKPKYFNGMWNLHYSGTSDYTISKSSIYADGETLDECVTNFYKKIKK